MTDGPPKGVFRCPKCRTWVSAGHRCKVVIVHRPGLGPTGVLVRSEDEMELSDEEFQAFFKDEPGPYMCPVCYTGKTTREDKDACIKDHGFTLLDTTPREPDAPA